MTGAVAVAGPLAQEVTAAEEAWRMRADHLIKQSVRLGVLGWGLDHAIRCWLVGLRVEQTPHQAECIIF